MAYKSIYKLSKPEKYIGDPSAIVARSSWERATFFWLEKNDDVISWSSEEIVINYLSQVDKKIHRYYPDLFIEYSDGRKVIVEIKPAAQTIPPKQTPNRKRYVNESITYLKNKSKWDAAISFCEKNGIIFEIWDEHHLKALGVRFVHNGVSTPQRKKRIRRRKSTRQKKKKVVTLTE